MEESNRCPEWHILFSVVCMAVCTVVCSTALQSFRSLYERRDYLKKKPTFNILVN